ncbi:KR domain-containing protein, partial [Diaporthe sp. PMI_573]
NDWDEFRISSWTSTRGLLEHCRGLVGVKKRRTANPVHNAQLQEAAARREKPMDLTGCDLSLDLFYAELESRGAGYSSVFMLQPGSGLKAHGEYSTCSVAVPDTTSVMPSVYETPSIVSTAFLDLSFHPIFAILGAGSGNMPSLFMPSAIKELEINSFLPRQHDEQIQVIAHGRPDLTSPGPTDFSIDAWHAAQSEPVVKMTGFRMTPVNGSSEEGQPPRSLCYKVQWEPFNRELEIRKENGAAASARGELHPSNGTNGQSKAKNETNGHNMASTIDNLEGRPIVLVVCDENKPDKLISAITNLIQLRTGLKPSISSLSSLDASSSAYYICLVELDASLLFDMPAERFECVRRLLLTCSSILWVGTGAYRFAENPKNNIAQGLLRAVRSEANKIAATLDLDPNSQLEASDRAALILQALEASLATPEDGSPVEYEFAEANGMLMVPRIIKDEDMNLTLFHETQPSVPYLQHFEQPGRRIKIAVGTAGDLNSLYWKNETSPPLAEDEIEIKIACTGMNFKDVVIAMGQVASPYLGVECSGTVARIGRKVSSLKVGDRVCAMSQGAYSTYARCAATSAAVIPEDMSFEIAASIPVVYSTAYYGIVELANMRPGETILIHAASGGVGRAAIQLSKLLGAEIYATVGSAEKKQLLIDTYGIPKTHIFYSRDTTFGPAVREATGGRGVDVVLNSLAGDLMRESWECVAPFRRFIELGKWDITSNTRLDMAKFDHNCSFSSVDLTLVAEERPKTMGRVLVAVMDLLAKKVIKHITPITAVGISEVETALRKLQTGTTLGKVVVSHIGNQQVKAVHPATSTDLLQRDATYLIIGGTGGLGRSLAKRMVQRGARHIVLLSRSGKITDLNELIEDSKVAGASIYVTQCDVADEAHLKALVAGWHKRLPPIRGVIHAAMILRDVLFERMTYEDYQTVVRSKISGAWNFHNALLDTPLDFFIFMSSVAGIVGNRGQAAYAAANTFLDAFTHYRRRNGLAATALDLTAVEGVGYLAENADKQPQVLKNLSGNTMGESEVLALVEAAIGGRISSTCDGQCITGLDFENPSSLAYYACEGKFSQLRDAALAQLADADASSALETLPIAQQLRRASTAEAAREMVTIALRDKLGAILMLPAEVIVAQQTTTTITAFGLDSLNAIELRNWMGRELQAHLQVLELLTSGGLGDLAALVLRKTRMQGVWSRQDDV